MQALQRVKKSLIPTVSALQDEYHMKGMSRIWTNTQSISENQGRT